MLTPHFSTADTDDSHIVYAQSLTFLPTSEANDTATALYGPGHGFVDDHVAIGLGLRDSEIATIRMSIRDEILPKMEFCAGI